MAADVAGPRTSRLEAHPPAPVGADKHSTVLQWRFEPVEENGVAVETTFEMTVKFRHEGP